MHISTIMYFTSKLAPTCFYNVLLIINCYETIDSLRCLKLYVSLPVFFLGLYDLASWQIAYEWKQQMHYNFPIID